MVGGSYFDVLHIGLLICFMFSHPFQTFNASLFLLIQPSCRFLKGFQAQVLFSVQRFFWCVSRFHSPFRTLGQASFLSKHCIKSLFGVGHQQHLSSFQILVEFAFVPIGGYRSDQFGFAPFSGAPNVVLRACSPIRIACKEGSKLVLRDYF